MRTHTKHERNSPLDLLTELAVEGTSTVVEAQRTVLDLAEQENEILFNGLKQRIGKFAPAIAMTDMVRRSLKTLIGMQQDLLTSTARQTMEWVESEKPAKDGRTAQLLELVSESVQTFTSALQKFLEVVQQESTKIASGKLTHEEEVTKKTELTVLAREATTAFIEAQKRLVDVMSQQANVNLDVSAKSLEMLSPAQLVPTVNLTQEGVKDFFKTEADLIGSLIKPRKPKAVGRAKTGRNSSRHHKPVAV